ncbi:TraB/GumN family protein [Dongshaea marina]|uniref:TraB/GumN family protein n=1 Tax=Dongshaea marina TaxID=2047966 RepID=UPI000D3EB127|nr:TraB/GumN family protein [Dongshaea marina]
MGFRKLLVWLSLLLSVPAMASSQPPFWKATRDGQTLWVLGSIHVGSPALYPLPKPIEKAFKESDLLVTEANPEHISDEQQRTIDALTTLPEGTQLSQELTPDLYQKTIQQARALGLSNTTIQSLQPWYLATLMMAIATENAGYSSQYGIDLHFLKQASASDKPNFALESISEQFEYLSGMGTLQSSFLETTLNQLPQLPKELKKILVSWKSGDLEQLQAHLQQPNAPKPLKQYINQQLLERRTQHWVTELIKLKQPQIFVVVGALHLGDNNGLLKGLEREGYQLQRQPS